MPLTENQKAYIAGIVDGEGCIILTRSYARASNAYFYPQVKIANTDGRLIDYLKSKVGVGSIGYTSKLHAGCKDVYHWGVASNEAYKFLLNIRDYLIIKQRQADVCIALWEENRAAVIASGKSQFGHGNSVPLWLRQFREACFWYLKDLNRRGRSKLQHREKVLALLEGL